MEEVGSWENELELADLETEVTETDGRKWRGRVRVSESGVWLLRNGRRRFSRVLSAFRRRSGSTAAAAVEQLCTLDQIVNYGLVEEDSKGQWFLEYEDKDGIEQRIMFSQKNIFGAIGMVRALGKITGRDLESVVVVLGDTGSGKSLFCSRLGGLEAENSIFKVGSAVESVTSSTSALSTTWRGKQDQPRVVVVDTPGWNDSRGRDAAFLADMLGKLSDIGGVNTFVLLVNGDEPRLRGPMANVLQVLETKFGPRLWEHVVLVFSRWYMDRSAQRRRTVTREQLSEQLNEALRSRFPQIAAVHSGAEPLLKAFFLDSNPEEDDEDAFSAAQEELDAFCSYAQELDELDARDVQTSSSASGNRPAAQSNRRRSSPLHIYKLVRDALGASLGQLRSSDTEQGRITIKVEVSTGPEEADEEDGMTNTQPQPQPLQDSAEQQEQGVQDTSESSSSPQNQEEQKVAEPEQPPSEEDIIRGILDSIDLSQFAEEILKSYNSIAICRGLTHSDLRGCGIPLFSQRDKIITAFKDYEPGVTNITPRRASQPAPRRSRNQSNQALRRKLRRILRPHGLSQYARKISRLRDSLDGCRSLTHTDLREVGISLFGVRSRLLDIFQEHSEDNDSSHSDSSGSSSSSSSSSSSESSASSSSSSGSSRSSRSSTNNGGELEEIRRVLRGIDMERYFRDISRAFSTIARCKEMTHSDLRMCSVLLFGERDKIITAFRDYNPSTSRRRTRRRGGRTGSEESQIRSVLSGIGMENYFREIISQGHNTIAKCKELTHTDLRNCGVTLFGQRDKIITAFKDYTPSSSSRRRRRGRRNRSSNQREAIRRILREIDLESYFDSLIQNGHDTIEKCKRLTHQALRTCGLSLFGQREKVMDAFRDAQNPPSSSSGSSSGSGSETEYEGEQKEIQQILKSIDCSRYVSKIINEAGSLSLCRELTNADLRRLGVTRQELRQKIISAFRESSVFQRRGSTSSLDASWDGGSSDESSGESGAQDSKNALRRIFRNLNLESFLERAIEEGFTLELGKSGSHLELKAAGVSMRDRFDVLKACKEYEAPSSSSEAEDSEEAEQREEIKKVLEDAGLSRYTRGIQRRYKTVHRCKQLTQADLRAAGIDSLIVRDKIIQAFRDHEAETPEERRARKQAEEMQALQSKLEEAGLEEVADILLSHFPSLERCKKLTHEDLREAGMSTFAERHKVLSALKENYTTVDSD